MYYLRVQSQVSPVLKYHILKLYSSSQGGFPSILHLETKWKRVVALHWGNTLDTHWIRDWGFPELVTMS
jgi:hypothetical protein